MTTAMLQVLLPAAMNYDNTMVGVRQYDLTLYPKVSNYYTALEIDGINIIPNFAPVQVWIFRNDVELGRYASSNGRIEFSETVTSETPILLRLFNLSVDVEVMLSIRTNGVLYGV